MGGYNPCQMFFFFCHLYPSGEMYLHSLYHSCTCNRKWEKIPPKLGKVTNRDVHNGNILFSLVLDLFVMLIILFCHILYARIICFRNLFPVFYSDSFRTFIISESIQYWNFGRWLFLFYCIWYVSILFCSIIFYYIMLYYVIVYSVLFNLFLFLYFSILFCSILY